MRATRYFATQTPLLHFGVSGVAPQLLSFLHCTQSASRQNGVTPPQFASLAH
jgi:hypothetical protein